MIALLLLSFVTPAPQAACVAVDGDRIEMRHLRRYLEPGVDISDDAVFGAAPQPGVTRTVTAAEFIRWARAHGADNPRATGGCFAWETHPLTEEQVTAAMRASLDPAVELKLVEFSRFPVPDGNVIFERAGLSEPGLILVTHPVIWNGYVQYSHNRKVKIWTKVILSVSSSRVTAIGPIKAGETIQADQVTEEKIKQFPYLRGRSQTLQDVVGRVARRSLRAGAVIGELDVVAEVAVKKGDLVVLEAPFGHGLLRTQAVAQASARVGDRLLVRNPDSGKVMPARLVAADRAVVIPGLMPVAKKGQAQ